MRNNRGFTLIEIIVTLGVSLTMIVAIYAVMNFAQKSSAGLERKVAAQQDEKAAMELMSMEIRMASCNPLCVSDSVLWVAACDGTPAVSTQKGIRVANANSIEIQMDVTDNAGSGTEDGVIGATNEIIQYNYNTVSHYITRATNCGPAQPFLGAAGGASTVVKTVRVINNAYNPVIPVFRYFDGVGTDISATVESDPANTRVGIPAIRRIQITLAVETENIDPNTRARKRMIYSTSVIVRNHAPNLQARNLKIERYLCSHQSNII